MTEPDNQDSNDDTKQILGDDEGGIDLSEQLKEISDAESADDSEAAQTSRGEMGSDTIGLPEPEKPVTIEKELEKYKELAARSQADLENYRKRMARERIEAIQYANYSLFITLLPVIDNFEMGLKAAKAEGGQSVIYQGMEMVQKQLQDFLSENRVETIEVSEGAEFDPNLHEAIKQEPSETIEEGKIIYSLRNGYRLKDRLLRPANVVVSKGVADSEENNGESPSPSA
jgi:molecular chaperone GrpE